MPRNEIILKDILSQQERFKIDTACTSISDVSSLAEFLSSQFSLSTICDLDVVRSYMEDSSHLQGMADCLFRPRSEHQCAIISYACNSAGIPYTVSAGRSNLTGSATPSGGIIVSTEAMLCPKVFVDTIAMSVSVSVSIFLEDLRNQVISDTDGELFFPVDPTSRSEATVGGAISCNASGFTPGKSGAMRHWVESVDLIIPSGLKLEASRGQYVSIDGKFILKHDSTELVLPVPRYLRPHVKNAAGPYSVHNGTMDFVDLIVGSEGIFGMVTSCRLKLQRRPTGYLDLFFSLSDEESALTLLAYLSEQLPNGMESLSAFEYFGVNCRKYMDHQADIFHDDDPVAIYLQQPLSEMNAGDTMKFWFDILTQDVFRIHEDAILCLDTERILSVFMKARHSLPANSLQVVQQRGTRTIVTDTVVPPDRFKEFLSFAHETLELSQIEYLSFGHLGDCHLHFVILPTPEQLSRGMEIYDQLVSKSSQLGGVYSGEHGTGKSKRHDFALCYGKEGVEQIRQCKAVVDPQFLLNRGNVIETNQ